MEIAPNERVFVIALGWAGSTVAILGLIGNTLTLLVLTRKDFRQSNSTLYLIFLCAYDTTFLAFSLMTVGLDWMVYGLDPYNDFNLKFTVPAGVILDPASAVLICCSVYTTVALTIDRCIAVTKPLNWPSICTRYRVKLTILAVFLWSVIYNIPFYMEYDFHRVFISGLNKSYLLSKETDYSQTYFHTQIYLDYISPIVTMVIPIITIVCPNIVIIVVLKLQNRRMESSRANAESRSKSHGTGGSSNSSSRSNRLTAQVLFISGFTLLSRVLHSASYIALDDAYYINECSYSCACVAASSAVAMNVNAAINFVCYCLFGEKFRAAFVQTACGCFSKSKNKNKNTNSRSFISSRTGTQSVFSTTISKTIPDTGDCEKATSSNCDNTNCPD